MTHLAHAARTNPRINRDLFSLILFSLRAARAANSPDKPVPSFLPYVYVCCAYVHTYIYTYIYLCTVIQCVL